MLRCLIVFPAGLIRMRFRTKTIVDQIQNTKTSEISVATASDGRIVGALQVASVLVPTCPGVTTMLPYRRASSPLRSLPTAARPSQPSAAPETTFPSRLQVGDPRAVVWLVGRCRTRAARRFNPSVWEEIDEDFAADLWTRLLRAFAKPGFRLHGPADAYVNRAIDNLCAVYFRDLAAARRCRELTLAVAVPRAAGARSRPDRVPGGRWQGSGGGR